MSNKAQTIIVGVVCFLVTIALIITIFFLAEINRKLQTPTNLMVVDNLPNGEILLQVDKNVNAEKYVFSITKNGKRQNLVSLNNFISATNYFEDAGVYKVACRVVGKTNASISDYCENVEFVVNIKLETPSVYLDKENDRLVFSTVTGATNYELIYGISQDGSIAKITESKYFGEMGKRYFDLSGLSKGCYSLRIVALGGEYEQSDFSAPIEYLKNEKLQAPTNVEFNNVDKILSFNSSWHKFLVVAYYDGTELTKTINIEDDKVEHSINLTEYLTNDLSKLELMAVGNSFDYTLNSDKVIWENA